MVRKWKNKKTGKLLHKELCFRTFDCRSQCQIMPTIEDSTFFYRMKYMPFSHYQHPKRKRSATPLICNYKQFMPTIRTTRGLNWHNIESLSNLVLPPETPMIDPDLLKPTSVAFILMPDFSNSTSLIFAVVCNVTASKRLTKRRLLLIGRPELPTLP